MQSVLEMKESSVYQAIVREGIEQGIFLGQEQGHQQKARDVLVRLATRRFGPPSDPMLARLKAADLAVLDDLLDRVLTASGWDDLFAQ